MTEVKTQQKEKKQEFFTDDMHKEIFTFQPELKGNYASKGRRIHDPVSTRTGVVRGGRKTSVR